ncbi:MAG: hypothetical protein ACTHNI_15495, partial [Cellulosimicrobium cellulans]
MARVWRRTPSPRRRASWTCGRPGREGSRSEKWGGAERIAAARDEGDLKENGGYHAAREEQAKNEARIRELTEKLRNVQIGT